ncbi:NAD-dependent deacylase [Pseudomonas marincola]|uniref:NAD-dependent deacylase n=1 Tax=Pseudomonas marincola TaxID=437900 RepID=UPI0008EE752E|nr:NAD-dependent deacylase [Pseudomonas marincola]SFT43666.1 NAD-dependent deacetylase [Pseudomonas marincola]
MQSSVEQVVSAIRAAKRILVITGAGLSADSGLPTYRGLGGLYNGKTAEGLAIETALSGPMLRRDPALCWKYLAELARACMQAEPNAGHYALAKLQQLKPECWVLTQNIDGYHRVAGSPDERLIEIHGEIAPLFCQACGEVDAQLAEHLQRPLPPLCKHCGGILRPPVVLFEEMLPTRALAQLQEQMMQGFDLVMSVGTTASFGYITEPILRTRFAGGFTVEVNPTVTALSETVDVHLQGTALDVLPALVSHI